MRLSEQILCKITAKTGTGASASYEWAEWQLQFQDGAPPAYVVKVGGRFGGPLNLSYAPAGEFAVGDFALAAAGFGAAGLLWELTSAEPNSLVSSQVQQPAPFSPVAFNQPKEFTGLQIQVPRDGTYLIFGRVTGEVVTNVSAPGDSLALVCGVGVVRVGSPNTEPLSDATVVESAVSGAFVIGTAPISFAVALFAAEVLTLRAGVRLFGGATFTSATVLDAGYDGGTHLGYLKLG